MDNFWPYFIFIGLAVAGIIVNIYVWKRIWDKNEDEQ